MPAFCKVRYLDTGEETEWSEETEEFKARRRLMRAWWRDSSNYDVDRFLTFAAWTVDFLSAALDSIADHNCQYAQQQ